MQPARTRSRSLAAVLPPVAALALVLPLALPAEAADSLPSPSPSSTPWSAVSADGGAVPTPSAVRARIDDLAQQKSLKRSGVVVVDPGTDQHFVRTHAFLQFVRKFHLVFLCLNYIQVELKK